jgi:hypothetical protein
MQQLARSAEALRGINQADEIPLGLVIMAAGWSFEVTDSSSLQPSTPNWVQRRGTRNHFADAILDAGFFEYASAG